MNFIGRQQPFHGLRHLFSAFPIGVPLADLKARGLTSDWELSRGYTAAKGLAPSYVPNSVTSVQLSYASAHCNVDPKERARLLELLRSSGYADPT